MRQSQTGPACCSPGHRGNPALPSSGTAANSRKGFHQDRLVLIPLGPGASGSKALTFTTAGTTQKENPAILLGAGDALQFALHPDWMWTAKFVQILISVLHQHLNPLQSLASHLLGHYPSNVESPLGENWAQGKNRELEKRYLEDEQINSNDSQLPAFHLTFHFLDFQELAAVSIPYLLLTHHHRSFHPIKAQQPLQFVTNPVLVAAALKLFSSPCWQPQVPQTLCPRAAPKPKISGCDPWRTYCTVSQSQDQPGIPSSPQSHFINAPPLHQLWLQKII